MTSALPEVTWSAFLRDAKAVADRIDEGDIVLHRREGQDLYLGSAERHEAALESMAFMSRLLATVISAPHARERLSATTAMPWLRFLPEADQAQFADEFVETAAASAELGTLTPLTNLVAEWRNTALVHADPRLAAALRREHRGEGGIVPRPSE